MQYLEILRDEVKIPMIYVGYPVEEVVRLATTMVRLLPLRLTAHRCPCL
jgi:ABC-type molybdate transport system ATPase subunit